ncbi:MAG: SRPBCC family protein [Nitrosomonadales bacterium]|nr:SRPBCC family protein [Nitrosomonadales bacterium]
MLKLIAILIIVVITAILVLARLKPSTFRVERSAIIHASPDKVFAYINDFQKWKAWSAWEKKDVNMKTTYSGPPSGKGAVYEWNGNRNVGSGKLEIVESSAPSTVIIKLDFITPFEGHNQATFTLQPVPEGTKIVWVMDGPMAFIPKVFSLFISMDHMIGKDFEDSLESLKAVAEK